MKASHLIKAYLIITLGLFALPASSMGGELPQQGPATATTPPASAKTTAPVAAPAQVPTTTSAPAAPPAPAPALAASPEAGGKVQETTPGTSTLALLTPQVSQGALLVISGKTDNTFDVQPGNNEVAFKVNKGGQQSEKARSVSSDGRVMTVLVPNNAQSGGVTVRKGTTEIGKLNVSIEETSLFKEGLNLLVAMFPALLFLGFLFILRKALRNDWSLAEALSESEPVALTNGTQVFPKSASRLIAFIGFFGIIIWGVGLMVPACYRFACNGEVPDMTGFTTYLLAQAGVFAPYVANKIAGALK